MNKNTQHRLVSILLTICFFAALHAHSRVAFSRPGSFIRTPSSLINKNENKFFIGFSNETINIDNLVATNAIFFKATSKIGVEYGASYIHHAPINLSDSSPPSEFSFHFNKEIYQVNDFIINIGIQDVLYKTTKEGQISAFMSLINKNIQLKNNYSMQTAVGFGSGKISSDSYNYNEGIENKANIFFGIKIFTPLLKIIRQNNEGLNLLIDYDGLGLNLGVQVPITKLMTMSLGLTHIENLEKFNKYETKTSKAIYADAPGLSVSMLFDIPRKKDLQSQYSHEQFKIQNQENKNECYMTMMEENYSQPLTINPECSDETLGLLVNSLNKTFNTLFSELTTTTQDLKTQKTTNLSLINKTKILQDSINMQYLNQQISQSEINIGMKLLSNSLQHYYSGDYNLSLKEAEKALQHLPSSAYIYARKGSIYYKTGDLQRATLNWNIALQLDPEYDEVRSMLISVKQELSDLEGIEN